MNTSILCAIRHAVRATPVAVVATGVVCPVALGNPGDLVPGFGDVGRYIVTDFHGPAQFLELQGDTAVFGGGETDVYDSDPCYIEGFGYQAGCLSHIEHHEQAHGFAGRLLIDGAVDTGFAAPGVADIQVIDAATQSDRKIVGIGRRTLSDYLVFRLDPDGALDASFGAAGIRELTDISLGSVAVDPAGTIVIAGSLGGDLKVIRLRANGDLDDTFGTAGIFTAAAEIADAGEPSPLILRSQDGGYRITVNEADTSLVSRCRVLALTATGAVDESFGDDGYVGFAASGSSTRCMSMGELPDGRLLVAGAEDTKPLLVRLVKSGATDTTFVANGLVATTMTSISALAVDPNTGSMTVAGAAPNNVVGIPVARLRPDGSLDQQFGNAGATWVDMPGGYWGPIFDVKVLSNSDALIVGGGSGYPYAVRLDGKSGNGSPGVLGVKNFDVEATEESQQAVVTVRRMGGKSGNVSVAYTTQQVGTSIWEATEGSDYSATSGRLEWTDGDASDKQIVVPIAQDSRNSPEESEWFQVALSDAHGAAGLGTTATHVHIASDAPPAGMFSIEGVDSQVDESAGVAHVYIGRGYSSVGAVSVTLTLTSGTATAGKDFRTDPVTVHWDDGDADVKVVDIPIVNDSKHESTESLSLRLADPTGGAIVGVRSSESISIYDDDPQASSGGGGQTGLMSMLLLALGSWVRALFKSDARTRVLVHKLQSREPVSLQQSLG